MTDPHDDDRLWPASPFDLADAHRCPACFTLVSQPVCTECGLALTDHRTGRVLELGRGILASELERQSMIAAIRADQVAAPVAAAAASAPAIPTPAVVTAPAAAAPPIDPVAPVAPAPPAAPVHAPPVQTAPLPPAYAAVPPTRATDPAPDPRTPRRRLTVPVLLLIVGVSLVGIAAIFFVTLAWFVTGIAVRATIVGGITVATIVGASIMRRRGALPATAEGLASLGIVLLGLDAWAIRANDLFGLGDSRPVVWAGASALVVAVLLRVWARFSHLRVPDLAASVAVPAGLGLLLGGLLDLPPGEAIAAGLLGAAAGGLLHALPSPWSAARPPRDAVVERTMLATAGVAALVGAATIGAFATEGIAPLIWITVGVIVLGAAHTFLLRPREDALPWAPALRGAASALAAVSAATVGWQLAWRDDAPVFASLVAPVVAVGVAVALDRFRLRWLAPATIAAGAVAALTLVAAPFVWLLEGGARIATTWTIWQTDAVATPPFDLTPGVLSLVASVVVIALLFLAPTAARPGVRDVRPVIGAVLVLAAASRTALPLAVVVVGVVVVIVSVIALTRTAARVGWIAAGAIGAVGAYLAGMATPWLWLAAVVVAAALPIAQRAATRARGATAAASVVASIVVLAISALIAPAPIAIAAGAPYAEWGVAFVLWGWISLAAIVAGVALRIDPPSRAALVYSASVLAAFSIGAVALENGNRSTFAFDALLEPWLAIVRGAALLIFFGLAALRRAPFGPRPALVAAFLLAPLGVFTADAVVRSTLGASDVYIPGPGWAPLVYTGVAVVLVWAAGVKHWVIPDAVSARTRIAIDLGALASALVVVWPVDADLRGALIAIIGLGLAGASFSRGWAAPRTATTDGFPTTRSEGVPVDDSLRRLFAWPAFAALTLALWVWLDSLWPRATLEAYVITPAVGLVAFAALLLWLRRRVEAVLAFGIALVLGLVAPAVESWTGTEVRGIAVALVASGVCLALTLTPARRISAIAVVGASLSLAAVVIATLGRSWSAEPAQSLWLLLALAVALASAFGIGRGVRATGAASVSSVAVMTYGLVAPSIVLLVAGGGAAYTAGSTPSLSVAVALLVVTLGLHVASAALGRVPFTAALRWTSVAVAAFAAVGLVWSDVFGEIEFATLPIAGALLLGALVAARRPEHSAPVERGAWIAGLAAATVPSLLGEPDPLRVWLVIGLSLVAAVSLVFLPVADIARLKAPSAVLLTAAALAMALRALAGPSDALPELAAIVSGVGAVAVAAGLVRIGDRARGGVLPVLVAGLGVLVVVWTVALRLDGTLTTTAAVAVAAGAIGVVGALLLGSTRWFGFAAVVAIGGAVTASLAIGVRISTLAATTLEPDLWAILGVAIVTAIVVAALRASTDRTVGFAAAGALVLALTLFVASELSLLGAPGAEWRALLAISVVSAAGIAGYVLRARFGLVLLVAAGILALVVAVGAVVAGVRPIEVVTVAPAVAGVAVGAWRMRTDAGLRSWPALGVWLGLLTIPSLLHDFFGGTDLWRIVALGVVAIALVLVGAIRRLQAPLVLGSVVLLVHAVAQLWPWIAAGAYVDIWWLWLGLGGALLIFVAATYEKRMRQLKTAYLAVTSLR